MQTFNNGSLTNIDRKMYLQIWTKESDYSLKNRFIYFYDKITFAKSNQKYAIVGTNMGVIFVVNINDVKIVRSIQDLDGPVSAIDLDDDMLVTCSETGKTIFYELDSGK